MLVLLPFSMGAQEVDQSVEKRIDSLATEVTTLDKVVQKLSKFKVSAYIQGQYQYGQEDATLKVGDKNENLDKGFNRIGIRRGRMKFEYNDGIGTGAVQIEVNDKVELFEAYKNSLLLVMDLQSHLIEQYNLKVTHDILERLLNYISE